MRFLPQVLFCAMAFSTMGNAAEVYKDEIELREVGYGFVCHGGTASYGPIYLLEGYGAWGNVGVAFGVLYEGSKGFLVSVHDYYGFDDSFYYDRCAWIGMTYRSKIMAGQIINAETVFADYHALDVGSIPETPIPFDVPVNGGQTIYLCFCMIDGTTYGWVQLTVDGDIVTLVKSQVVIGTHGIRPGFNTTWDLPSDPNMLMTGGIRARDIYVDGSVAVSGSGRSWASPFKEVQEAAQAIRLTGTTVHVKPGIYAPVFFDTRRFLESATTCHVSFVSTDGPQKTIIDGHDDYLEDWSQTVGFTSHLFNRDLIVGFTIRGMFTGSTTSALQDCVISNCLHGLYNCHSTNCLSVFNGHGVQYGSFVNGVIYGNETGILSYSEARNTILYGNIEDRIPSVDSTYTFDSCLAPYTLEGNNIIVGDPLFVDPSNSDFRLRSDSPCIDAGNQSCVFLKTDIAGNRRVQGRSVDIGCYEYGASTNGTTDSTPIAVPFTWLSAYTNTEVNIESDYEAAAFMTSGKHSSSGTPILLWQEYLQGTDPNDSNDVLRVFLSTTNGIELTWVPDLGRRRRYTLYGTDILTNALWSIASSPTDSEFLSTNRFFKIGVDWQ